MNKSIRMNILLAMLLCLGNFSCSNDTDLILDEVLINEPIVTPVDEEKPTDEEPPVTEEPPVSNPGQTLDDKKIHGSAYCGPYTSSKPLVLSGLRDTIISGLDISNPLGHAITITNCQNVTIKNSYLHHSSGNGILIVSSTNIVIQDNRMESIATGVYAQLSQGIKVLNNDVKNVLGPFPRGQLAQFAGCRGSGNKINYNVLENIFGESNSEDAINLFKSSGIKDSPIEIIGNWIRGGGPSRTGGGIMTGDNGGSFVIVKDNILVDPGQYGIAIAGGTDIEIFDNIIYAKKQSFTNVGLYIWNQSTTSCSANKIYNNSVYWKNKQGNLNAKWNSGNCGTVIGWEENHWNAGIDENILPQKILMTACSSN